MDPWDPIITACILVGALCISCIVGYFCGVSDQKRVQEREAYKQTKEIIKRQRLEEILRREMGDEE